MDERPALRRRQLVLFWVRVICFFFLTIQLLNYATYVLTPKHDYGICSMVNLYRQPEDTVDVLSLGTSLLYSGVNTNVLWREYGIAAYNLCSAEQPFWVSYYQLKEALKTQRPQVILLDAKPAIFPREYSKWARTILSTYGIRGLENRLGAIASCVESPQEAMSFVLGLPQVHSNYQSLTWSDFQIPPDNGGRGSDWKGYIEMDAVEHHARPSLVWSGMRRNITARGEEYARKIFALCQSEGIELLLVAMPNPDYANDHMYYNTLWAIAEEYGFGGINYNHPDLRFGLRYSVDFADWQHLNVKGSITTTRKLGQDLLERYALPDHRGEAAFASYDSCADSWYAKLPMFASVGPLEGR